MTFSQAGSPSEQQEQQREWSPSEQRHWQEGEEEEEVTFSRPGAAGAAGVVWSSCTVMYYDVIDSGWVALLP